MTTTHFVCCSNFFALFTGYHSILIVQAFTDTKQQSKTEKIALGSPLSILEDNLAITAKNTFLCRKSFLITKVNNIHAYKRA